MHYIPSISNDYKRTREYNKVGTVCTIRCIYLSTYWIAMLRSHPRQHTYSLLSKPGDVHPHPHSYNFGDGNVALNRRIEIPFQNICYHRCKCIVVKLWKCVVLKYACNCDEEPWSGGYQSSGGRLNKKVSYQYTISHYKDHTVSRPFYRYNGNTNTSKYRLCIETGAVFLFVRLEHLPFCTRTFTCFDNQWFDNAEGLKISERHWLRTPRPWRVSINHSLWSSAL